MDPRHFNQAWEDFQPLHERASMYAPLTKEEEQEVKVIVAIVVYGTIALFTGLVGYWGYIKFLA